MNLFWWGVLAAVSVTTHALIGLLYYWLGLRHGAGLPRRLTMPGRWIWYGRKHDD